MKKLRRILREESGSTTILLVGILFFGVVLMVLFANFAKIFAVADRGSSAAEQASLAASDVVYKEVKENVIDSFTYICGFDGEIEIICHLSDDYDSRYNPSNEMARKQAIDQLFKDIFEGPSSGFEFLNKNSLRGAIGSAITGAVGNIQTTVSTVINDNKGEASGSQIFLFNADNRIEVWAKAKFESIDTGLIPALEEDIGKKGMGVTIPFIDYISWSHEPITIP